MSTAVGTGNDISPAELLRRVYRLFHNKRFGLWLIFATAFLSLLGALFSQVPADVRANPVQYSAFLDQVRGRYRGWTMPLSWMGVFHMFSSWPFRIVNLLLVLSIIACTTHRLPTLWRNATSPHTHVADGFFDHARTRHTTVVAAEPAAVLADARATLGREHFRILDDPRDPSSLYADRNRWMPLGTALAHTAFVLVILGMLVTNNTGFRNDEFTVPVGMGPQPVGHGTGLAVQANSFTDAYHDDGSPMDYAADLVLFKDGQQVKQQVVRVNSPLSYDGVRFNQSYFGFAADLTVTDAQGKQLLATGVPLQYSTADKTQTYGKTTLPNGLQMFVITPASGQTDAEIGPGQVRVEVYQPNQDTPMDSQVITQGRRATVGGMAMTFNRERQFTGLMAAKDNGAPLVWVGSLLLVLGICSTMFFRHQRVWLRVRETADGTQVRVASPDRHDTLFEQKLVRMADHLGGGTPAGPSSPTDTTGSTHA